MPNFLEIIDKDGSHKVIHKIPMDNIGDIVISEDSKKIEFDIAIYDRQGKELFTKSFKDAYTFDDFVERINNQLKKDNK